MGPLFIIQGDKISMWLCEAKPQESIVNIGQRLKGRLGIEEKVDTQVFLPVVHRLVENHIN
jgi:hypothetical protein